MTGFRVAAGGAQELYGVTPDLTTFGKIIGGGLPVGAYGGRKDIMSKVSPAGPVYQAGTLSGNPLAMAAGYATLSAIRSIPDFYTALEAAASALEDGLRANISSLGLNLSLNRVGSMFTLFFTSQPVTDYASAVTSDTGRFARYFRAMLEHGVYLPPSQYEAAFVSAAHGDSDITATVEASNEALKAAFP
jgi:glutamate-1-semialdehyde 2,1-aminomutase